MRYMSMPRRVKWVPAVPVLGSLVEILQGLKTYSILDTFVRWHRELGMTYAFKVPSKNFVASIDPKNIEHVLKDNFEGYVKGHLFSEPFTDLFGSGIFNVDGKLWYMQRKIASRMFTKKQFENHIWHVVEKNTAKVAEILERTDGMFDFFDLLNRFTLDTIGEIGFSCDIGSLEDPSSPFLQSFDRVQQIMNLRFWLNPFWKVLRWFDIGFERELKPHLGFLDEYARRIVHDLLKEHASEEESSFVGLFIREASTAKEGMLSQETFLRDMVLNFLIAGRDTTAQCISWTVFELTQNPGVIEKAREEIAAVCGDAPLRFEHIRSLRYVQAVLDEGLRLHPSVPYDMKVCARDDCLPDGTVVPKGCVFLFSPYAQGRCEAIWGSDACKYRPERWLEMQCKPSAFTFSAFNAGPRECLGRRLAEMEMVTVLTTIIRNFDLALEVDPQRIRYDAQLTLGMGGLPLSALPRSLASKPVV